MMYLQREDGVIMKKATYFYSKAYQVYLRVLEVGKWWKRCLK